MPNEAGAKNGFEPIRDGGKSSCYCAAGDRSAWAAMDK